MKTSILLKNSLITGKPTTRNDYCGKPSLAKYVSKHCTPWKMLAAAFETVVFPGYHQITVRCCLDASSVVFHRWGSTYGSKQYENDHEPTLVLHTYWMQHIEVKSVVQIPNANGSFTHTVLALLFFLVQRCHLECKALLVRFHIAHLCAIVPPSCDRFALLFSCATVETL